MRLPSKVSLPALACCAVFLSCELVSRPWAEMGVGDDFSYIYSARILAQTGHIAYNGWATAIVGWQLYLSAAFIKVLGFSFTAARLPTLIVALITTYLLQRTLVRFGVTEGHAVVGALTFVLSPLFMPLSATMMTDVPGFFSMLACTYSCVRALQAHRDRDTILWLCFAVGVNAICGTSRQIAWLGALVLVPSTLWLLRSRRAILLCGFVATAIGYVFVFTTLHWFSIQPYALADPIALAPLNVWAWKHVIFQYLKSFVEIDWMLLPMTLPFLAGLRRFSLRNFAGLAEITLIVAGIAYYLLGTHGFTLLLDPFNYDWVGPHAMFENTFMDTKSPTVLNPILTTTLSVIAMAGVLTIVTTLLLVRPPSIRPGDAGSLSWHQIVVLFGPMMVVYSLLLSRRGENQIFDRYLILPIFVTLVCLLLYSQQHLRFRLHAWTYAAVAAVGFYGILSTHNLFAFDRARVALSKEIAENGVPLNHVDLGFEMNAWNEIQTTGYVNESRLVRPMGAYHAIRAPQVRGCHEEAFGAFPHLAAEYGFAFDPNVCNGLAPFAPVSYSTWPLRRPTVLYVVRYPGPTRPESDYGLSVDSSTHE